MEVGDLSMVLVGNLALDEGSVLEGPLLTQLCVYVFRY